MGLDGARGAQKKRDPAFPILEYPGDTSNSWVGLNQTLIADRLIIANWDHSDQNGTQGKQMTNSIEFFGNILGMQQLLCGCALAIAHTAI